MFRSYICYVTLYFYRVQISFINFIIVDRLRKRITNLGVLLLRQGSVSLNFNFKRIKLAELLELFSYTYIYIHSLHTVLSAKPLNVRYLLVFLLHL
jgi:hypothetical protein